MKKKKILFFATLLVVFSLVAIVTNYWLFEANKIKNNEKTQLSFIDLNSEDFNKKTEQAFLESFGEKYQEKISKNMEAEKISTSIDSLFMNNNMMKYPEEFGGKYINENNDLVVQIVKKIPKEIASLTDKFTVEYVENSYEELENTNNSIINYFVKNGVKGSNLVSNYIDVKSNNVVVELKSNSLEEQKWFKENVIDSEVIKFIQSESNTMQTTTYNAGGSLGGFCSIGYRAKMNGNDGFITAGHCVQNGQLLGGYGNVTKRVFGGSIDAAFIQLYSGNSVSNNLQYPYYPSTAINASNNIYPNPNVVGTFIAKAGIKTGATAGSITNANFSYNNNGTYLTGFVKTSAQCNNGDSGGVVYKPGSPQGIKTGTVVGIVHAKSYTGDDSTVNGDMSYSRSDFIDRDFNLTRY